MMSKWMRMQKQTGNKQNTDTSLFCLLIRDTYEILCDLQMQMAAEGNTWMLG